MAGDEEFYSAAERRIEWLIAGSRRRSIRCDLVFLGRPGSGGIGGRSGPFVGELSLDEAGSGYAGAAVHGSGRDAAGASAF